MLRRLAGFHLLGIDAPVEVRFERSKARGRTGDGASLEDFVRDEEREQGGAGPGQQLRTCLSLADVIISNDGTIEELRRRVRLALASRGVRLP